MNDQEKWLRDLFSQDVELPESMEARLSQAYERIRRESRGKETNMKRLKRKGIKTFILIAAIVALLSVTALAVYQYGIKDAEMELMDTFPLVEREETVYRSVMSYNGFKDSPEYQAFVEWQNWNNSWWAENWGIWQELGVDDAYYETPENYYYLYNASFQEQAEKLDEILEKYGLTAHTSRVNCYTTAQFYRSLGLGDILPDSFDLLEGYIYDDGTFKVTGKVTIDGEEVWMGAFLAVEGSFSLISNNMPENYEEWSYVTASGVEVILVVGEDMTYVIAGLDGSYMVAHVEAVLEREQAEAMADSVDLTALNDGFATEKAKAAVAASVAAFAESQASATTTDNITEGTDIVLAILGNYYLAELPESHSLWRTSCALADVAGSDGCYTITHYYEGPPAGVTLRYRTLQEGETALEFSSPEEQDSRGVKETACTVNGYEGILTEHGQGTEYHYYSVKWLDTDRELVFSVSSDSWAFTREDILTYAESVTAEDPDLETGAEAYAARAAQYQEELDAITAQSWAEYEAYQAEEDAAAQAALEALGDYDITASDVAALTDIQGEEHWLGDSYDWDTGYEYYGYGMGVRKIYDNDMNLVYTRYWLLEDESVLVNERYFTELQEYYEAAAADYLAYTGGLSVNGCEAFMTEESYSTAGSSMVEGVRALFWYDTDSELIFVIMDHYMGYPDEVEVYTAEELTALAESVSWDIECH